MRRGSYHLCDAYLHSYSDIEFRLGELDVSFSGAQKLINRCRFNNVSYAVSHSF